MPNDPQYDHIQKFHSEKNVIITANVEIDDAELETYLKENLNTFPKGSVFFTLAGHHHSKNKETGEVLIDKKDADLVDSFGSCLDRIIEECEEKQCVNNCQLCEKCHEFHSVNCHANIEIEKCQEKCYNKCSKCVQCNESHMDSCGYFCLQCTWKDKKFSTDGIIPIFTQRKTRKSPYELTNVGKKTIKRRFQEFLKSSDPHVLIFASCYSHKSKINNFLWSCGIYSCLLVSAERGEITCGKTYHLDDEQQDVIKMATSQECQIKCKY